jgi:putative (di)nucleoside polyphosphate hydrolase
VRSNRGMKTISHGILILNPAAELLLCHATGGRHWDVPKGMAAAGESSAQAALREAAEECGLLLNADDLTDLGCFAYRPQKDLRLHGMMIERIDPRRCHCSSVFRDRHGRLRPEMDAFVWTPFADIGQRCAKSLAAVLTRGLCLPQVLADLVTTARLTSYELSPPRKQQPRGDVS